MYIRPNNSLSGVVHGAHTLTLGHKQVAPGPCLSLWPRTIYIIYCIINESSNVSRIYLPWEDKCRVGTSTVFFEGSRSLFLALPRET